MHHQHTHPTSPPPPPPQQQQHHYVPQPPTSPRLPQLHAQQPTHGEFPLPDGWDIGKDFDGKTYYIDHINKKTTWLDPRDEYTKPRSFEDCVGDELPRGWEEAYDPNIGRYYINHIKQTTQLEDPRQEWKSVQEKMLRDYLSAAQDQLENKREIFDVKQQRLLLAQEEFDQLNKLAASRNSLCSSSSSVSRHDPELLRADLMIAKDRVRQLKQELSHITNDITYAQRGMNTLYSVGEKINAHQNGCYDISEVQAIREEMLKVHKSLVSGEKVREELMLSLLQIKNELSRQQLDEEHAAGSPFERICVASQTDLCGGGGSAAGINGMAGNHLNSGARLAEMAKTKLQYADWRKHIKKLQQQLAEHVERIEPGQLESDQDRLLLIQEKEQLLNELNSFSLSSKKPAEVEAIQQLRQKIQNDLKEAYEASNNTLLNRMRLHEEKKLLLDKLQEALKSTKLLEERLKSFSSESTFSLSSGSSMGSTSTMSSSKSTLSFMDIYSDPLTTDSPIDITELQRRSQRLFQQQQLQQQYYQQHHQQQQLLLQEPPPSAHLPAHALLQQQHSSEISLSSRSSLSMETPPASPMRYNAPIAVDQQQQQLLKEEPTYANAAQIQQANQKLARSHPRELDSAVFDCMVLEAKLQNLKVSAPPPLNVQAPLSPISEKPSLLDIPQAMLSHASSASNTRSVSAAVSNESVAGDSGVFEASRAHQSRKELAQAQIGLNYIGDSGILIVSLERASNLSTLVNTSCDASQVYLRAGLQPNSHQFIRTKAVPDFQKPVFNDKFAVPISLNKLMTKTLTVEVLSTTGQKEELIGSIQISMAEFNPDDSTLKWYNVLSLSCLPSFADMPSTSAAANVQALARSRPRATNMPLALCKEESSDESTITSSQTSTLTRNQGPSLDLQAQITEELPEHINAEEASEDEDDEDDDDEDEDDEEDDDDDEEDDEDEAVAAVAEGVHVVEAVLDEPENDVEAQSASAAGVTNMLEAYLKNMKQDYANKETNTEYAFHPEQLRLHQQQQQQQQMMDDRPVKRSQTFTPSAAANKNRYTCRLNRSDSDSAMHFGVTPHPFHRGALERRSLRFHTKAPKPVTKLHHTHIPRTSLDLELDLQAQHSKLHVLNDQIAKLQNLKDVLQKARDNKDPLVTAWAIENEEFQRLVARADPDKCPEEKQLKKFLMKTAKEIHKLRKTKVPKGSPDLQSFREKMYFFTRKGLSVPELPSDFNLAEGDAIKEEDEDEIERENEAAAASGMLAVQQTLPTTVAVADDEEDEYDDEDNVAETTIAITTGLVASNNRNKNLSEHASRREKKSLMTLPSYTEAVTANNAARGLASATAADVKKQKQQQQQQDQTITEEQQEEFNYVVKRTYGVEV